MASVVFFIQHILVAVERFLVELKKSLKSTTSGPVKEQHFERRARVETLLRITCEETFLRRL